MQVVARYSWKKVSAALVGGLFLVAAFLYLPPILWGSYANFFENSFWIYAWAIGAIVLCPALLIICAVYGYRIVRSEGVGVAVDEGRLTVVALPSLSVAKDDIASVEEPSAKRGMIAVTTRRGDVSLVAVGMMAGSANSIAGAVREALSLRAHEIEPGIKVR